MSRKVRTITQRVLIPARPEQVYDALTSATRHAAVTSAKATGARRVGARFTAYDGYIMGVHRELKSGAKIVQDWWTTEWPEGASPSRLQITLRSVKGGTELRMVHSAVPAEQADSYRQGWIDYYWTPLQAYFSDRD
jgi:activator of HSP90 ATPase